VNSFRTPGGESKTFLVKNSRKALVKPREASIFCLSLVNFYERRVLSNKNSLVPVDINNNELSSFFRKLQYQENTENVLTLTFPPQVTSKFFRFFFLFNSSFSASEGVSIAFAYAETTH